MVVEDMPVPKVDIEQEILNKVGKLLLIGLLTVTLLVSAALLCAKEYFWYQVDQEVSYQMDKLGHTPFGDIVSRSEVRVITIWRWVGKINIVVVRLSDSKLDVYINVQARGEDASPHSFHTSVTTADGLSTTWGAWQNNTIQAGK